MRRLRWAAAACVLSLPVAAAGPSEYEVKAAFLFNFSKFVEWPEKAFAGPGSPIAICVLGENPFGTLLEDAVRGKQVNGRDLEVRDVTSAAGCHVVFVGAAESARDAEVFARLADQPVLTVSDAETAAARGAIIGLTLEENRVRFEVNLVAARKAGVKLSSQLLKVAVRLIGRL